MQVTVPAQFEDEYWSNDLDRREHLSKIAAIMAGNRTPLPDQVEFLIKNGWSREFSEWVVEKAERAGTYFSLHSKVGGKEYDESVRNYEIWRARKAFMMRNAWISFGVIILLVLIQFSKIANVPPFLFTVAILCLGGSLSAAKGTDATGKFVPLAFLFQSDQNTMSPPQKPADYDKRVAWEKQLQRELAERASQQAGV